MAALRNRDPGAVASVTLPLVAWQRPPTLSAMYQAPYDNSFERSQAVAAILWLIILNAGLSGLVALFLPALTGSGWLDWAVVAALGFGMLALVYGGLSWRWQRRGLPGHPPLAMKGALGLLFFGQLSLLFGKLAVFLAPDPWALVPMLLAGLSAGLPAHYVVAVLRAAQATGGQTAGAVVSSAAALTNEGLSTTLATAGGTAMTAAAAAAASGEAAAAGAASAAEVAADIAASAGEAAGSLLDAL